MTTSKQRLNRSSIIGGFFIGDNHQSGKNKLKGCKFEVSCGEVFFLNSGYKTLKEPLVVDLRDFLKPKKATFYAVYIYLDANNKIKPYISEELLKNTDFVRIGWRVTKNKKWWQFYKPVEIVKQCQSKDLHQLY